ncbi:MULTISPECIES: hypothetical protein [Leptolyngbya]|nr:MULTISPECIES: hypothetical protein [Leptolyngbya]MBD2367374.1 hypothetical protein [Leptolyngbya sp. FACHB-161]ULP29033.1 hypothetical protein MCP04_23900 [Leptolyngbya boryana IU 594]
MQETDARSLRAALAAIAESPNALDPEMIQTLNQVAIELKDQPASAIAKLRQVMKASALKSLYEEARQELLAGYQSQPRGKEIQIPPNQSPKPGENEIENLSVPLDRIAAAQEILAAKNPSERAQEERAKIANNGKFWEWVIYLI